MKRIDKLENLKPKMSAKEQGINGTFYWAYRWSRETNNKTINFCTYIYEDEISEIINHCKEFGIKYITISSDFPNFLDMLTNFKKNNCEIGELTTVKTT